MPYSGYERPALKSTVDVQLQSAFSDGNWNTVVRLADKRAKSLRDPYYEVCVFVGVFFFSECDAGYPSFFCFF